MAANESSPFFNLSTSEREKERFLKLNKDEEVSSLRNLKNKSSTKLRQGKRNTFIFKKRRETTTKGTMEFTEAVSLLSSSITGLQTQDNTQLIAILTNIRNVVSNQFGNQQDKFEQFFLGCGIVDQLLGFLKRTDLPDIQEQSIWIFSVVGYSFKTRSLEQCSYYGLFEHVPLLLQSPSSNIRRTAALTVGNFAFSSDSIRDQCIMCGILPMLIFLLTSPASTTEEVADVTYAVGILGKSTYRVEAEKYFSLMESKDDAESSNKIALSDDVEIPTAQSDGSSMLFSGPSGSSISQATTAAPSGMSYISSSSSSSTSSPIGQPSIFIIAEQQLLAAVPTLCALYLSGDSEISKNAFHALAYISEDNKRAVEAMHSAGVYDRVLRIVSTSSLLTSSGTEASLASGIPASEVMSFVVIIANSSLANTNVALDVSNGGGCAFLISCLSNSVNEIRLKAAWALGNLASEGKDVCMRLVKMEVLPVVMRLMPLGPPRVSYEMGILLQNMFGLSDAIVDEAIMERIPLALAALLVTTDPSLLSLVLSLLVVTARRAELLRRREKLQYHREKEAASQAAQPPGAVVCIRPPSNAVADDLAEGDAVPQLQAIAQSPNAENRTAAEFLLLLVEREEKRGTGEMDEDTDSSPEDTEQYNDNDNDIDNDDDDDADADVDDGAIANSNESGAMDVA